jgi:glutamate-5-semialdehyde dehydrogenase
MSKLNVSHSMRQHVKQARDASLAMSNIDTSQKNKILYDLAETLRTNSDEIMVENTKDMNIANKMLELKEITHSSCKRVELNKFKIEQMAKNCESVATLPDPAGKTLKSTRLDDGLDLHCVSCPIGVIMVIFESRPDVVVQISALAIKSGNAVILKGGKEAQNSNRMLAELIRKTLEKNKSVLENAIILVETRDEVTELVKIDSGIDLIIPRGSNELVRHIQENARAPVLGHGDGICHVYLHEDADQEKSLDISLDAKLDYPAVCNALETLLVHNKYPDTWLANILIKMQDSGVELRVCPETKKRLELFSNLNLSRATDLDWETEYVDLILAIKTVKSEEEALEHISQFGSKHTEAIITENADLAERFMKTVDAAGIFWNASTRFADGFRYGLGAEVVISTGKTHARGPVGLEGLVIYKYKLYGNGHVAGNYGKGKKDFIHEEI